MTFHTESKPNQSFSETNPKLKSAVPVVYAR